MKTVRLVVAFLLAPLVTFPVAMAGISLLGILRILSLTPDFDFTLDQAVHSAELALIWAYWVAFILGAPTILVLCIRGALRRRPLEVTGALLGALPLLPMALTGFERGWWEIAVRWMWLAVGVVSGFLAGHWIWHAVTKPLLMTGNAGASRPAEGILTVLYDARCAFCRHAHLWLEKQPKYVSMTFVAAGSEEARRRFPDLDHGSTLEELTVVGWRGEVYREAKAWIMCLWALKRYRSAALRFSTPERMPMARRFVAWISRNRTRIAEAAGWTR
jgi:predicted DCC family thiol-disulfide oxidoreductase YuxK